MIDHRIQFLERRTAYLRQRLIDLGIFDPRHGLHPLNGTGVPHDGCQCKNCREARR